MRKVRTLRTVPALPEELGRELAEVLGRRGVIDYSITAAMVGGQSTCFIIRSAGTAAFVLKVFSPEHFYNTMETVAREFKALGAFREAAAGFPDMAVPEPVAMVGGGWAYLMTFVTGANLDDYLGRMPARRERIEPVARTIVAGLDLYYGAVSDVYGDFHPGNVLVRGPGRLSFIDPVSPDPFMAEMAAGAADPICADLGFWAFAVAANVVVELRTEARPPLNRVALAAALIREASRGRSLDVPSGIFAVARSHLDRMVTTGGPKEAVLGKLSGGMLRWIERSVD